MSALPVIGFVLIALLAIAFAVAPLLRRPQSSKKTRALLSAAIALAMLGIGGGTYWMVGRPHLAQRSADGLKTHEMSGLVPYLIERARANPKDPKVWRYLAQAYMGAGDPGNAAKALSRAIQIVGKNDPALNTSYGEALTMQAGGAVPPEAEAAFTAALRVDPKNIPARFYLGMAMMGRGDRAGTVRMWQSVLADVPVTAPLHQMLVDRIAVLTSQGVGQGASGGAMPGDLMSGSGAPDPRAMVARLAERLKTDPNDALGWVRLIRAYVVLGEMDKAREALASARATFKDNKDALTAFSTIAKDIK